MVALEETAAPFLRHCWGKGSLRDQPAHFVDVAKPLGTGAGLGTMPNATPATTYGQRAPSSSAPPYVFAVPWLPKGCPRWFQLNVLHTRLVQAQDPIEVAHTVLVEGPNPTCGDWVRANGVVHYAVPRAHHVRYRSLLASIKGFSMWSTARRSDKARHHGAPSTLNGSTAVDVEASNDVWLLSVIRYFYLHDCELRTCRSIASKPTHGVWQGTRRILSRFLLRCYACAQGRPPIPCLGWST